MTSDAADTLETLRALSEAATPGEWRAMPPHGERPTDDILAMFWDSSWSMMDSIDGGRTFMGLFGGTGVVRGVDARFIAAAVNHLRAALAAS